jgi:nicotinate-nucleotide adenylyltransferase
MDTADNRMKLTGVFGGTFDPVHNGHLLVAEQVRTSFGLDEIFFIPSGEPPHKKGLKITEGVRRIEMLNLAVEANPHFKVLGLEVSRKGLTYTVDTLHELNQIYGNEIKFYFIIGADVVLDLMTWKNYDEVFKLCEFIAVRRNGFVDENFNNRIKYLIDKHSVKIHPVRCPEFEVSSSFIRENVLNERSIKYLVPQKVEEYIFMNYLYKGDLIAD